MVLRPVIGSENTGVCAARCPPQGNGSLRVVAVAADRDLVLAVTRVVRISSI